MFSKRNGLACRSCTVRIAIYRRLQTAFGCQPAAAQLNMHSVKGNLFIGRHFNLVSHYSLSSHEMDELSNAWSSPAFIHFSSMAHHVYFLPPSWYEAANCKRMMFWIAMLVILSWGHVFKNIPWWPKAQRRVMPKGLSAWRVQGKSSSLLVLYIAMKQVSS